MSAIQRVTGSLRSVFAPSQPGRRLSRGVLASVVVAAGWLSVNLLAYASILAPAGEDSLLVVRDGNLPSAGQSTTIPDTPFFGRAEVKQEAEPDVDLANIPITQLNLVLSGVLDNSTKDKASALIAEKGKPAQRLYVGDRLPGGAELFSVAIDHIVLRRNGKMEKLTYPDHDGRPNVPLSRYTGRNVAGRAVEVNAANAAARAEKQQSIRERLKELRSLARERREARQ
ncbi:type II secretion system protein N [Microbulbifer sp. 2201CG32-9]|uniref:type II secretion system protein N n=1 Tax=Microbulbifer sp. 2201CG32-9 TaxID=3232309 RepID=UPI00345C1AB1